MRGCPCPVDNGQVCVALAIFGGLAPVVLLPGFVAAVDRGEDIVHLFDLDEARLVATARNLGVRVIVVERPASPRQHIDLCGAALRRAVDLASG